MPEFNYSYEAVRQPGGDEIEHWENETRLLLDYHEPDLKASAGSPARNGWGFPPHIRIPQDAYDYVAATFKREIARVRQDQKMKPAFKFSLIATLTTYFAWIRSNAGTVWLLKLYGIEVMNPHPGYVYFYNQQPLVEPQFGLRIYQRDRLHRTVLPPYEFYSKNLSAELAKILGSVRGPARNPLSQPSTGMWEWVGSQLRNWLTEAKADTSWPTSKHDRISGYQWARNATIAGSQTERQWNILEEIERFDDRCFRIQQPSYEEVPINGQLRRVQPRNPGRLWVGRSDMRVVPIDRYEKEMCQQANRPFNHVDDRYRCSSCGNVMPCTHGGPNDRLCFHCRGVQLENGDRPSLKLCLRRECKSCPEQFRTRDDLDNLVNRLNSEVKFNRNAT